MVVEVEGGEGGGVVGEEDNAHRVVGAVTACGAPNPNKVIVDKMDLIEIYVLQTNHKIYDDVIYCNISFLFIIMTSFLLHFNVYL